MHKPKNGKPLRKRSLSILLALALAFSITLVGCQLPAEGPTGGLSGTKMHGSKIPGTYEPERPSGLPEPIINPDFWSQKPISLEIASMSVREVIKYLDDDDVRYLDYRIFIYLDGFGWQDITKNVDAFAEIFLKVSSVDVDATGTVLIQLAD